MARKKKIVVEEPEAEENMQEVVAESELVKVEEKPQYEVLRDVLLKLIEEAPESGKVTPWNYSDWLSRLRGVLR